MADWIRRAEAWNEMYARQGAVLKQINLLGTRAPEAIAAALGESPERVAETMRQLDRQYSTRRELDLHYQDPSEGF